MIKQLVALIFLAGCASTGVTRSDIPPEFNQQIQLIVDDDYEMYQAVRSHYDLGDLQSFHSQHVFPMKVEDSFKQVFGSVVMVSKDAQITTQAEDTAPVFEVHIVDMAQDQFNENVDYARAHVTIAAAMVSPRGEMVWKQAFRGDGFVNVDPQFNFRMGPEQAVQEAVEDALNQLQEAIIKSPQVRLQLKHYRSIEEARTRAETTV